MRPDRIARGAPAAIIGPAAIIALAAATMLGGCSPRSEAPPVPPGGMSNVTLTQEQRRNVHLFTVAEASFHKTVDTTGVVDFDNDQATSVLAPFSGPVSRLLVSLGQEVKKGQALATADSPDFAAALSAYRKALATAKTNRHLADLDKDLIEHHGIAQREAAQAETDAVNAESDRDAALQQLVALNANPEAIKDIREGRAVSHPEATIRAPISGTVVEKLITPGQLLQAGSTACFTVADLSRVWVMAQVFGADLTAIHSGDSAEVDSGTGAETASGRIDNIAALVDPDTRAVAVRIVVENLGELLKKQMYVHVRIRAAADSSGLLVPVSAVLRDDENLPFVYLAGADDSFARSHVVLGYRSGNQYEISSGLRAGDRIVIEGGLFVQFMQSQ